MNVWNQPESYPIKESNENRETWESNVRESLRQNVDHCEKCSLVEMMMNRLGAQFI